MQVDWTIDLSTMVMAAGVVAAGLTIWVAVRMQVAQNTSALGALKEKTIPEMRADQLAAIAALEATLKHNQERVEAIRAKSAQELADFKLQVAREYATSDAIREVEERVVAAIERLGDRFDKWMDRQVEPNRNGR